jgi:hypothetical protein
VRPLSSAFGRIRFGTNMSTAAPGVFHPSAPGGRFEPASRDTRTIGVEEHHESYGSFATLHDVVGNTCLLQEITTRPPGRIDDEVRSYASIADLASAMLRASVVHGAHEARIGTADANWPDWYAADMVAEQAGTPLPE